MSEDNDKLYGPLKAPDPETWRKPDEMTWGDKFLIPNKPVSYRHKELARMTAHGKTNKEICEVLNYTPARVSVLLSNTRIKDEIEMYRDKLFGADIETRLKDLSSDALRVMEGILIDRNLDDLDKESAAKWILEKVSGKPAQQVDVKQDISIGLFLDKLDQMKVVSAQPETPALEGVVETTARPTILAEPEKDTFASWLDENL